MAIDTAEKRLSISACPGVLPGVTSNASPDAEWRYQVANNYSGNADFDTGVSTSPVPVVATFVISAVTITLGGVATASAPVVATFVVPAVTVSLVKTVSPDPVAATFVIPAVTITEGVATTAPAPVVATFVIPAVTVDVGTVVSVSPAPVVATFVIPAVTITGGAVSTAPGPVVATFVIPAVSVATALWVPYASIVPYEEVTALGTAFIRLWLWNGTASIAGESPVVSIERVTDGFYWNGSAFQASFTTVAMIELTGGEAVEGEYQYSFVTPVITGTFDWTVRHTITPSGESALANTTFRGRIRTLLGTGLLLSPSPVVAVFSIPAVTVDVPA